MLTEQQVIDFNPVNQKLFTDEQIAILQNLNNDELRQLAKSYPAAPGSSPFLILHDSGKTVQNGAKATYATLFNLRVKNAQSQWSISTVISKYTKSSPAPVINKTKKSGDMTESDLAAAPGIKKGTVKEATPVDPNAAPKVEELIKDEVVETKPEEEEEFPELENEAGNAADTVIEEEVIEEEKSTEEEKPEEVVFKPYAQRNKTELLAEFELRGLTAPDGSKNKDLVDLLIKDDAAKA